MESTKRLLAVILIMVLVLTTVPLSAFAADSVGLTVDTGQLSVQKVVNADDSEKLERKYVFGVELTKELSWTVTYVYNSSAQIITVEDTVMRDSPAYTVRTQQETEFSLENYEIASWNTEPDGSGESYALGEAITVTGDMVLYAQWRYLGFTHVDVTYAANSGTGSHMDRGYVLGDD